MAYQIFIFLIKQLVVRVGGRLLVDIKGELNFRGHFFNITDKLSNKERFDKEQIGNKKLFVN